jgi:hypothetical protein
MGGGGGALGAVMRTSDGDGPQGLSHDKRAAGRQLGRGAIKPRRALDCGEQRRGIIGRRAKAAL